MKYDLKIKDVIFFEGLIVDKKIKKKKKNKKFNKFYP